MRELLVLLACPVGMGVMMWVMMRGRGSGMPRAALGPDPTEAQLAEIKRLRNELDELRREDAPGQVGESI